MARETLETLAACIIPGSQERHDAWKRALFGLDVELALPAPTRAEYIWDLHASGVHTECKLAPLWAGVTRIGDGTPNKCPNAGRVERFHAHDYSGPLVCGCNEWGDE